MGFIRQSRISSATPSKKKCLFGEKVKNVRLIWLSTLVPRADERFWVICSREFSRSKRSIVFPMNLWNMVARYIGTSSNCGLRFGKPLDL